MSQPSPTPSEIARQVLTTEGEALHRLAREGLHQREGHPLPPPIHHLLKGNRCLIHTRTTRDVGAQVQVQQVPDGDGVGDVVGE